MIVCLIGSTCVGKTTTAKLVADLLDWPMRSCGIAVRDRAASLGVAIDTLDDRQHREVDRLTVEWAQEFDDCLIEGRFLDSVFCGFAVPVAFVRLVASPDERAARGRLRGISTFAVEDIIEADARDMAFRRRLYPHAPRAVPCPEVDNSGWSSDASAKVVVELVGEVLPPRA